MGLDMFLYKKTYVKNWDHMKDSEKHEIVVKRGGKIRKDIHPDRIIEIVEEIGYWRKANQIHKWMVDNVQDANDDCEEYYVSEEKLQELLEIVNIVLGCACMVDGKVANGYTFDSDKGKQPILEDGKVMKDDSIARELLPTDSGFFFGSTDYDQYYYEDLKHTKEVLEEALKEGGDYYYRSSW